MRQYIPLAATIAAAKVLLSNFCSPEPIKVPSPMASIRIACDVREELANFAPPPTAEDLEVEVVALGQRVSPELPLAERRPILEASVCNGALGIAQRGLALDVLVESEAMVAALDAGRNLDGNWHNRVTGSFGTVIVVGSVEANGAVCRTVDVPSYSVFGLVDGAVANVRETYCRAPGSTDWLLFEQIGYETYPVDNLSPDSDIAPSNTGPPTTV
jgi:hypothetical protein